MPKRKFKTESYPVMTRVPRSVIDEIEKLCKEGYYMDVSDYIRDIIRRDLQARRLHKVEC